MRYVRYDTGDEINMPNWCENKLIVVGDEEDLLEFKEQAKSHEEGIETDIRMNNFIPMPEELIKTVSPWEHPNWKDWALENWGCKWDLSARLIKETEDSLTYEFASPWSPPINWILNIAPMFPELLFQLRYKEGGMCFQGTLSAKDYLCINNEEEYHEYIDEKELLREEITYRRKRVLEDLDNMRF